MERGLNLPDTSNIPELCNILGITINELLEGKRLNFDEQKKYLIKIFCQF